MRSYEASHIRTIPLTKLDLRGIVNVKKQKDLTHNFWKMIFLMIGIDIYIPHLLIISKKFHPY